jgi:hypothetical protein
MDVVSFTLRPLYPQGKSPWCPLDRRLDAVKRIIPSHRRESNPRTPIIQPIAQSYTTELSWLISSISLICSDYFSPASGSIFGLSLIDTTNIETTYLAKKKKKKCVFKMFLVYSKNFEL